VSTAVAHTGVSEPVCVLLTV